MPYSFRAGVRLEAHKNASTSRTEVLPEPERLIIDADVSYVKAGDAVKKWQAIGETDGMPLHTGVSGKVTSCDNGKIVIESDFLATLDESAVPVQKSIKELSSEEIVQIVKNAGIYTDGVPAHGLIKDGKKALVINLLESEPFLCSAYRLSLEKTAEILGGAKILMKACGVRKAYIAVESTHRDVIKAFRDKIGISKLFELRIFKPKYPQDHPKLIAYALDGSEDGSSYAFFDGFCCYDVYRALAKGVPAVARNITVDGDCISTPKNVRALVGTPLSHIVAYCGGLRGDVHKIIDGGPMRGKALYGSDDGLSGTSTGLIFLSKKFEKKRETPCIRCGRCSHRCPMFLMPNLIVRGRATGAEYCIACGTCSYVCPANIPLTQLICDMQTPKKD